MKSKHALKVIYGTSLLVSAFFLGTSVYYNEHEVTHRPNRDLAFLFLAAPCVAHCISGFEKFSSVSTSEEKTYE